MATPGSSRVDGIRYGGAVALRRKFVPTSFIRRHKFSGVFESGARWLADLVTVGRIPRVRRVARF